MDLRGISVGISWISFVMNISVLCLLFWKGGKSRHTYLWASLMGLLTLWCFSEIFIKATDDSSTAISWFRFVLISGGLIPPLLLNFALEFPHRHALIRKKLNRFAFYALVYIPNIILLIKAEVTSFHVSNVPMPDSLWGKMYTRDSLVRVTAPDVYLLHYVFLIGLIFVAIYFIFTNLRDAQSKTEKKQLEIVALALSVIFIPGIVFDAVLSMVYGVYTEFFSMLISILAVMTAYGVLRYKFLVISPMSEDITMDSEDVPTIDPEYAYIVPENARAIGIKMFRYALSQKRDGIVITNKDPTDVRRDLSIKRTPIIFLGEKTEYKFHIDPGDLESLVGTLMTFTGMTENPVLLVDWDERRTEKGTKQRSDQEVGPDRSPLASWFSVGEFGETIGEAMKLLAGGSSMIIFQDTPTKTIIKTQRPTQQMKLINIFLLKNLLEKILKEVQSDQGDPRIVLKELGGADKFFEGWSYMEGSLLVPAERHHELDRVTMINKFRAIMLVLSRSTLQGASAALDKVWKEANLGGYILEEITTSEGTAHFIASDDQSYAFKVARELVATGYQGLCISTKHPDKIKRLYGLMNVEFRWITTSKTDDKYALPVSLEHILMDIKEYLKGHNEGLVLFDGIELLISRVGFENVQRFLHVLKDEVSVTKTRLMISIDPRAIDAQRFALLKKELDA